MLQLPEWFQKYAARYPAVSFNYCPGSLEWTVSGWCTHVPHAIPTHTGTVQLVETRYETAPYYTLEEALEDFRDYVSGDRAQRELFRCSDASPEDDDGSYVIPLRGDA